MGIAFPTGAGQVARVPNGYGYFYTKNNVFNEGLTNGL